MATPPYFGVNQRVATSDDWFTKIASLFSGSSTPAYLGVGQPAPPVATGIMRGVSTPIYAAAPVQEPASTTPGVGDALDTGASEAMCAVDCPIDAAALAAGQIAIVIPRERLGP